MRLRAALFPLTALLVLACSSAPKQPDEVNERKNRAAEYTTFGNSYYNQAQYARALEFFNMAMVENIAVDNERGIAQSYDSIGKVYMATGRTELAEESFQKALAAGRRLNDARLIAQSAANLGELYLIRRQPERALELLQEAAHRIEPKGMEAERAIILHNTGAVYKSLGRLDEALRALEQAEVLNLQLKRWEELASNHYMIASIHSKRGSYADALGHAAEALANDKKVEHSLGIARDLQALGLISLKAGQFQQGYDYLQKSYLVFQTLRLPAEVRATLELLVDAAERLGRTEEATRYREALEALGART